MSKIFDFVKPGVITGDDVQKVFQVAKENNFALPAVNCVGTDSINAVLEAAAKVRSPVIVQFSNGGAAFIAGKGVKTDVPQGAAILGAISGAHHVHQMAEHYGVPIVGPEKEDEFWLQGLPAQSRMFGLDECQPLTPDRWLNEGERVNVGNVTLQVLHCPGHTPGHIVFFDDQSRLLISGDVIFKGGVGRSDFPRGDHGQLIQSIKQKLLPLGDDVTFIPGHGPMSTLGYERLHNPFLQDEMPVW